jgi:hypothetical protein
MNALAFKPYEGKILELHFADGYSAVVKLLDVSDEHPGSNLIYDVLEVLSWGPIDPATVDRAATHAADASEIERFTLRDSPPSA